MSRRRHLQSQPAVSLFPFLAVLICTMGTLIVLLVVVVQQARNTTPITDVPAATATPVPSPALPPVLPVAQPEMVQRLEDAKWANGLLETSRQETLAGLEERRGVLSRIEDQVRSLSEQLGLLESQAQSLLDAEADKLVPNEQSNLYLQNLRLEIEAAKNALTEKQAEASEYRQQYAIIPYDGPNGTRRRPIYIECLADSVVIQPEGIRFGASDFAVKDASNPLASALRAYREYLSNAGLIQAGGEPYPLIVVRPNGERAYSACRAAMRSWDDEFGYELVPSDMKLAFPPADAGLKAFLQDAVAQSRARMQPAMVMSGGGDRRNTGVPLGANVAAASNARNGSMLLNSNGAANAASPVDSANANSGNSGAMDFAQAAATAAASRPDLPTYSVGKGVGGGLVPNGGAMQRPARRPDQGGTSSRRRQLVRGAARANGRDVSDQAMAQFSGARLNNRGTNAGNAASASATGPTAPMNNTANTANATGTNSSNGGTPGGSPGGTAQGVSTAVASGPAGGATGTASAGTMSGADPSQPAAVTASFSKSFAETQGVNWALPNAADGSIAIARPITATCEPGRIVVRTDKGNVAIPIEDGSVGDSVQPLVSKVWEVIDAWGIAGPGVYWKPTLHIRVKPGTEATYNELHALLQDSGLEIKQRK